MNLVKSHNPTVERLTQDPFENKNLTWASSQNGGQTTTKNANIDFQKPHPMQTLENFKTSVITMVRYKHNTMIWDGSQSTNANWKVSRFGLGFSMFLKNMSCYPGE